MPKSFIIMWKKHINHKGTILMKKFIFLMVVVITFNCNIENRYDIEFKIALSVDCDYLDVKRWYCVSGKELSRVKALPNPCDIITITNLSGREFNGVQNGFSSDKSITCIGG